MSSVAAAAPGRQVDVRVTFPRVLYAEWIRLRSLRSTWITMLLTIALVVGFGALSCLGAVSHERGAQTFRPDFDPALRSLVGTFFAQLAFGVLGVLVVTGEYSTGMIRATFTAVPRRMTVFLARLSLFAMMTFAVLLPTAIVSFLVGQTILAREHLDTTLGAPHVLRAVVGCALYLVAIGLLGMALGWLIRHTAGAIFTLVGVLFVVPLVIVFMPAPWPNRLEKWLPGGAGQAILHTVHDADSLGPWTGYGVLVLYVVAVLVAAAVLLRTRDV
ncbi:MAG: type transport system permease protein [Frankiaceae bacterium]|nr:type transport system permease protein [Frankiaceae bacterium]